MRGAIAKSSWHLPWKSQKKTQTTCQNENEPKLYTKWFISPSWICLVFSSIFTASKKERTYSKMKKSKRAQPKIQFQKSRPAALSVLWKINFKLVNKMGTQTTYDHKSSSVCEDMHRCQTATCAAILLTSEIFFEEHWVLLACLTWSILSLESVSFYIKSIDTTIYPKLNNNEQDAKTRVILNGRFRKRTFQRKPFFPLSFRHLTVSHLSANPLLNMICFCSRGQMNQFSLPEL